MATTHRTRAWAVLVLCAGVVSCGGGDSAASGGAGGPAPAAMCTAPLVPVVAAYDLGDGAYRWHACGEAAPWYSLEAATGETVYVSSQGTVIALDAANGTERWRGDLSRMEAELPKDAARRTHQPPTVDGVRLSGGQDDPLVATDAASGRELWRNSDRLTYDDVWAYGDGAVYMSHDWPRPPAVIRAYELPTGAIRWERTLTQRESYPWWVGGGRVFSVWDDLTVLSTRDGKVLWSTSYSGPDPMQPTLGQPGMRGVLANASSVFVAFATKPSGGD